MGSRSVRGRCVGFQEADLRDAFRRGQRGLRVVWNVLSRRALPGDRFAEAAERRVPNQEQSLSARAKLIDRGIPFMSLIVRSSDLHAAGVFATTRISKGEQVVEYTGPRISQSEGSRLYDDRPITYLFALDDPELLIDGHGTAAFINHSCDPNCETEEIDGHVWICAIRNIKPGEEIT